MYTTFNRFADEQGRFIKRYFFGNPYSRFIPILLEKYNVDTLKLVPGNFIKGDNYIIDLQRPNDKLQEVLRRQNPDLLTSINEEWNRFMKGEFINDENYDITVNHPDNYKLRYVIRFLRHNLMIYRSDNPSPYY